MCFLNVFSKHCVVDVDKHSIKPIFHLAILFARREAKTRIRQRVWLTLVGKKIRREQVETVPTFFCSREQIRQVENKLYFAMARSQARWDLSKFVISKHFG